MPLYEYRCPSGHRFEKIQSFSAPEQLECPKCGQMGERLLSAPAIQFKGSGFYLTDYGKSGGSKGVAGESGGGASSDGKSGSDTKSGSDSKPGTDAGKSSSAPAAPANTPAKSSPPSSAPNTGSTGSSGN